MTVYSDAIGNYFLGNCRYGNHDINYPSTNYLLANPHSTISQGLTNLCTSAGLAFRDVAPQSVFNSLSNAAYILLWGAGGDINDRYLFYIGDWVNGGGGVATGIHVFNDSGSPSTQANTGFGPSATNRLFYLIEKVDSTAGFNANAMQMAQNSSTISEIQWVGASDGNSLALCLSQTNFVANTSKHNFFFAGQLQEVNTQFGYYNASAITKSIAFSSFAGSGNLVGGGHYIASAGKNLLQTGDAIYPIACTGGSPTPTGQWATDMYVFDNNPTLGYPAIGKVPNMLLGVGTYTYLKPVELVTPPDAGSNLWLPVGTYAGRTLLMRCYAE